MRTRSSHPSLRVFASSILRRSLAERPRFISSKNVVQLVFIGLITQAIYVIFVAAFPLVSNTRAGGPAADLEILMRDYRWFAPVYVVGLVLLYYLFWRAIKLVTSERVQNKPHFSDRQAKLLIISFGLLFGLTLLWLYPISANDLFRYVVRGRVWAVYGANPMTTPPDAFPDDPYLAFAGEFANLPSVYGPLWELVVQIPLRMGAVGMVSGTVGLKIVVLIAYFVSAVLLGWVAIPEKGSPLAALTFFAWNPLILMQGLGNGHNDLLFMMLLVIGIVLWQRGIWWGSVALFTLAVLAKIPALLIVPLFGVVFLRRQKSWQQAVVKSIVAVIIGLATVLLVYTFFGPLTQTLAGVSAMLTSRRGFAIAAATRMVLREVLPRQIAEPIPRTTGSYIFIIFYLWLLLRLWQNKLNLVTAAFLAYFSQLMLGRTFRIWYPMWLVPLVALHLTPTTFWRTFLFGLTAELSIVSYFVAWRWWLRDFTWGKTGPLSPYWNYWTIMHLLTVPWLFGIPLFGPILFKRLNNNAYQRSIWHRNA